MDRDEIIVCDFAPWLYVLRGPSWRWIPEFHCGAYYGWRWAVLVGRWMCLIGLLSFDEANRRAHPEREG